MSGWQERVIQERCDLAAKLRSLTDFLDTPAAKTLNPVDLDLLVLQHEAMLIYLSILEVRIGDFQPEGE